MAKTPNIIISCADYRGEDANCQQVNRLGTADRLVALGASLGIVTKSRRTVVFEEIADLCALHGCTSVFIVDHMNCGKYRVAYGVEAGGQLTLDARRERQLHQRNLAEAKKLVKARFPHLKVVTQLLEHDPQEDRLVLPNLEPAIATA